MSGGLIAESAFLGKGKQKVQEGGEDGVGLSIDEENVQCPRRVAVDSRPKGPQERLVTCGTLE